MLICHITTVHIINDTRIFYKEIQSLLNDNFEVNYIVQKNELPVIHPNLKYFLLNNDSGLVNKIKRNIKALKYAFNFEADIYHLHDPELLFLGFILKVFKKKRVIYDIHEIYKDAILYKNYIPVFFRKAVSFSYDLVEKLTIRTFDHLILAEENYKKYYSKYPTTIVENYISKELIISDKNINPDIVNIVYVGGVTEIRGIWEMIYLIKMLSEKIRIKFHLVGYFYPEDLKEKVTKHLKENNLNETVIIYDRVSYPDAQIILKKCDIGLALLHKIDNHVNSLLTKFFEYMAAGLTVIMSDFELWKSFNKKYKIGLCINIENIKNHQNEIISFLQNKQLLTDISKNNRVIVNEKFTWDTQYEKLKKIYQSI